MSEHLLASLHSRTGVEDIFSATCFSLDCEDWRFIARNIPVAPRRSPNNVDVVPDYKPDIAQERTVI